jgi:hypothetical protein
VLLPNWLPQNAATTAVCAARKSRCAFRMRLEEGDRVAFLHHRDPPDSCLKLSALLRILDAGETLLNIMGKNAHSDRQKWKNQGMALLRVHVHEVEREKDITHVTLRATQVLDRNTIEEAWLDEMEVRALIRDLQTALMRGPRLASA